MVTALVLVVVCLLPVAAFWVLSRGFDWLVRYDGPRARPVDPTTELVGLAADLRRLGAEHDWLVRADVPGRAARLRAVELAYDDTLRRAAEILHVELPATPLIGTTRLQAEAELATHGFTW